MNSESVVFTLMGFPGTRPTACRSFQRRKPMRRVGYGASPKATATHLLSITWRREWDCVCRKFQNPIENAKIDRSTCHRSDLEKFSHEGRRSLTKPPRRCKDHAIAFDFNTTFAAATLLDQCRLTDVKSAFRHKFVSIVLFGYLTVNLKTELGPHVFSI